MMIRAPGILLLVLVIIMATLSGAMAAERTPPGSFLEYRASTISELTNQIAKNDVVRMRYAHHFQMAPDQVVSYFNENLQLMSLKAPLKVVTWYVDKKGDVYKKTKLLPKKTLVFVTKEGEPILSWSCGNPLRAKLPITVKTKTAGTEQVIQKPVAGETKVVADPIETKVLANPVETIAAAAVTVPPGVMEQTALAVAIPPAVGAVAGQTIAVAPPLIGSSFAWLGGAAGVVGGLLVLPKKDSSNPQPPPPPVPEPSGLLAAGLGLIMTPLSIKTRLNRFRR